MRNLARTPTVETAMPLRDPAFIDDIGGPVAAIQRSIMERMAEGGAFEIAVTRAPETSLDRGMAIVSRCVGPIALGIGYLVAARLIFG